MVRMCEVFCNCSIYCQLPPLCTLLPYFLHPPSHFFPFSFASPSPSLPSSSPLFLSFPPSLPSSSLLSPLLPSLSTFFLSPLSLLPSLSTSYLTPSFLSSPSPSPSLLSLTTAARVRRAGSRGGGRRRGGANSFPLFHWQRRRYIVIVLSPYRRLRGEDKEKNNERIKAGRMEQGGKIYI